MANSGNMRRRHRVLLVAEAANPEWTSVPLIGWKLSRALANVADVHLVTQVRNRDAIIRTGLIEGRDFAAIDNERVAAPVSKLAGMIRGGAGKGWTTKTALSSLAYYSFEFELWRQFKSRLTAHEFDLVHRITPLSPHQPEHHCQAASQTRHPLRDRPSERRSPVAQEFSRTTICRKRMVIPYQTAIQTDAFVSINSPIQFGDYRRLKIHLRRNAAMGQA